MLGWGQGQVGVTRSHLTECPRVSLIASPIQEGWENEDILGRGNEKIYIGDFLGGPVVENLLPVQGTEVLTPGPDLRSYMLWS